MKTTTPALVRFLFPSLAALGLVMTLGFAASAGEEPLQPAPSGGPQRIPTAGEFAQTVVDPGSRATPDDGTNPPETVTVVCHGATVTGTPAEVARFCKLVAQ